MKWDEYTMSVFQRYLQDIHKKSQKIQTNKKQFFTVLFIIT